jgi:hypothetical protein
VGILFAILFKLIMKSIVRVLGLKLTLAILGTIVAIRAWTSKYWEHVSPLFRRRRQGPRSAPRHE